MSELNISTGPRLAGLALVADTEGGGTEDDAGETDENVVGGNPEWRFLENYPQEDSGEINDMHFVDDQTGWMAVAEDGFGNGGGFYYTEDGGYTWEHRKQQTDGTAITTVHDTGLMVGTGQDGDYYMWTSQDGQHWVPVFEQTWKGGLPDDLENLVFWTNQVGLGINFSGSDMWRTTTGLDHTEDGALELTEFEELFGGDTREKRCNVEDLTAVGDEVWAVGSAPDKDTPGGACILHAPDRGEPSTWMTNPLTDEKHSYSGGSLHAIHVVGDGEMWAVGDNRQVFESTDGGDSWEQIGGFDADISTFRAITGRGDHMFLAGFDQGGQSGQGGIVLESTDGGDTWQTAWRDDAIVVSELVFVHDELLYGFHDNGAIVRWTP
jgi:photosystem II stability/assembly factor-like uncharacterized protein